ncbi:unnamed protein product [Allacma fusca]|uniref:SPIN90/Ldb17 leucine-rich domain-containing protein n=1 Tax=Allacma fusca TaxID=39272 RepID=A0A8J2JWE6_9HEXA|nr:unnamed protein product [Allacma fusca]
MLWYWIVDQSSTVTQSRDYNRYHQSQTSAQCSKVLDNDGNWLRVSNRKGQIGLVPINYVDANHHVSGGAVIDFLDESLQIARREKSPHLQELHEIRRNILNPINDLERRLKEFQHLIAQLKAEDCTTFCDAGTSSSMTPRNFEDDNFSLKSGRTVSRKFSTPFVQYVDPRFDNDSNADDNRSRRDAFTISSYDSDNRSISAESSLTYTCSNGSRKKQFPSTATNKKEIKAHATIPVTSSQPNLSNRTEQMKLCNLIDTVRQNTGISYESSQHAVHTVLQFLKDNSPGIYEPSVNHFLKQLQKPDGVHKSSSFIRSSADYERLYVILCELSAQAQDDEIWETQDDLSVENVLQEMNAILGAADKRIVIKALEEEGYDHVYSLTLYFQKEHRWSRRKLLIQSFAKIASIDLNALSVLLNSVLPVELAREMMDSTLPDKYNRLETAGSLLGLLLSTGEKLPVRNLEYLGKDFLNFVLDKIDASNDSSGDVTNVLINLLLAYNLQFGYQDENLTVATLASRRNAKLLTQKIVHLLLWEQDPISVVNQDCKCPDSVLKLLLEMFTCSMTADLFYTNDTKVLIDIVIRSLMNWEPGEKKRTLYLQLIRMIIRNSNFREHNHRRDDLVKIFTSILLEEDPLALQDQRLIREITNEFPTLIK